MFVDAIESVRQFTRPIQSIARNFGSDLVQPGTATLFFINADGWALTCRHVAEHLVASEKLAQNRKEFARELASVDSAKNAKKHRRKLKQKYGYFQQTPYEVHNRFVGCIDGELNVSIRVHDKLDIALLHFCNFEHLLCHSFPTFAENGSDLKAGKLLCRLGYPFPEFTSYAYDPDTDTIRWTNNGRQDTPWFPIEGMVTRRIVDNNNGGIIGFEMSTPGLRGQSGGPVFDFEGRVWGMQFSTKHLDLNFDIDQEVVRNGTKVRVSDNAFLHVGHCIHVDEIKSFMTEQGVQFQEG